MSIGEKIRSCRIEKNVSQEELADALGVSRQIISRWEKDKAAPSAWNLEALSSYFHVSSDYLLKDVKPAMPLEAKAKRTNHFASWIVLAIGLSLLLVSGILYGTAPKAKAASSIVAVSPVMAFGVLGVLIVIVAVVALLRTKSEKK